VTVSKYYFSHFYCLRKCKKRKFQILSGKKLSDLNVAERVATTINTEVETIIPSETEHNCDHEEILKEHIPDVLTNIRRKDLSSLF